MTFKPFCDSQIHTKENPLEYDCLINQLLGHNCICPYAPQNIFWKDGKVRVALSINSAGGLEKECRDFEIHPEFLKQIGQPSYDTDRLRVLADVPE
jgi:hypothetical protein